MNNDKHQNLARGSASILQRLVIRIADYLFDRPAAYRVLYADGNKTYRMKRSCAENMKETFGGKLLYDPPEFDR